MEQEQAEALAVICGRRPTIVAAASASELAALRRTMRPVYAQLERDPETRGLIVAIRRMHGPLGGSSSQLRCPSEQQGSLAKLAGAWRFAAGVDEMVAAGASPSEAETYGGSARLELAKGRWVYDGEHATVSGTYTVEGDLIRLTMRTCTSNPCSPGMTTEYAWSVYRDTLSLVRRPGGPFWPMLTVRPASRAR
jgi:hypothetical protein